MTSDQELLREYATKKSEAAFETLAARHVGLVYSAALRQTPDPHTAEDVTQAVFVVLAQKAAGLPPATVLPAWLLTVTRLVANNARRQKENQRKSAEAAMNANRQKSPADSPESAAEWGQIAPLLDDAIADLPDGDRDAVVLRFFQRLNFDEVGGRLGITTDAAKKRVERGLDKLRRFLFKRGVDATMLALAAVITEEAVQAAPQALTAALPAAVATAVAGVHITKGGLLAQGAMKTMATMKAIKLSVTAAVIVTSCAAGTVFFNYLTKDTPPPVQMTQAVLAQPTVPPPPPAEEKPATPKPKAETPAEPRTVSLLDKIDVDADAVNGKWRIQNGELYGDATAFARLELPYRPPEEYDLRAEFTVLEANQDVKLFGTKNGKQFAWLIGMDGNRVTCIDYINWVGGKNATRRDLKKVYTVGQKMRAEMRVRNNGIACYLNGKLVTSHETDYKDMNLTTGWKMPSNDRVGIGSWLTPFVLHSVEVADVTGQGTYARKDGEKSKPRYNDEASGEAAWAKAVNVLAMTNAENDAVVGKWTGTKEGLSCEAAPFARLELPYRPPEEYDLRIVYTVDSDKPELQQFLSQGGKSFQFGMYGNAKNERDNVASFQAFDRYSTDHNPSATSLPFVLNKGAKHTSEIRVRKVATTAYVDGEMLTRMSFGYKDAHLMPSWVMPTKGLLGIGANDCAVTIHSIHLLEITGKGTPSPSNKPRRDIPIFAPPAETAPVKPPTGTAPPAAGNF